MLRLRIVSSGGQETVLSVQKLISVDDTPYGQIPEAASPLELEGRLRAHELAITQLTDYTEQLAERLNEISEMLTGPVEPIPPETQEEPNDG